MKLKALALDYDGTIAEEGRPAKEVTAAVARARSAGVTVLLVTGRILGDLRRVAGDLSFVDAVVAENGAVVAFPASGRSSVMHEPPPRAFLEELARRGVAFETGEVVVEAEASTAPIVLDAIRALELPLMLSFNRSRMMILPQAISKATGLLTALDALRLSSHNTLAIGDAENDHELLRAAEVGVAVAWGSAALKAMADEVLPGKGPAAVGPYIDSLVVRPVEGQTLQIRRARRHVLLGSTSDGRQLSLGVTGRNVLISGDPRSGKSWVGGLLCEQLILHGYCVWVIDPEGDYASLEVLPRVSVVGGDDPPPKSLELLHLLRHPDRSIVIDLSRLPHAEKLAYLRNALPQIRLVRQRTGLPHRVLIDEAHYFLNEPDALSLLDVGSGGCTAVTYQTARLHPDVLRAVDVVLVSRATDPEEVAAFVGAYGAGGDAPEWGRVLGDLTLGEVALLPGAEESQGRLRRIRLIERLTPHIRHRMKYLDVPVDDRSAFVFSDHGRPTGDRAHTLKEFVSVLGRTAPEALTAHVQRADFSRWVGDVFGDRSLAAKLRQIEAECRLGRVRDINDAIAEAVRSRYDITGTDV